MSVRLAVRRSLSHPCAREILFFQLAKLAAKLEVLGMKARAPEFLVPLCGTRTLTVVVSVNRKLLPALNIALAKLVGQAFHVVLLLRPDVNAEAVRRGKRREWWARQTYTQTGRPENRQTIRQTDRQIDRIAMPVLFKPLTIL